MLPDTLGEPLRYVAIEIKRLPSAIATLIAEIVIAIALLLNLLLSFECLVAWLMLVVLLAKGSDKRLG